jgi:Rrf2 family protein
LKLIKRDTDYAIRAVLAVAKRGRPLTNVTELVRETKIPRPFLRKIMQLLGKQGMIRTFKGRGGGISLTRDLDDITVMDILNVFQEDFKLSECVFKKKACRNVRDCKLRKKIVRLEDHVASELASIKLSDLR